MKRIFLALGLALVLTATAGEASAQMSFKKYEPKGFKPITPAVTLVAPKVQPLPGYGADNRPAYTSSKPKTYATPAPRPLAPIGAMDSSETFKPYKPAKGYSTYDHDTPGRKKTYSTY